MVAERDAALREPLARGEPITGRELAGTKAALLIGQVEQNVVRTGRRFRRNGITRAGRGRCDREQSRSDRRRHRTGADRPDGARARRVHFGMVRACLARAASLMCVLRS